MTNWSDPAEIQKQSEIFVKLIFTLFGLYIWELFVTWEFEWSLLTRRRAFRWPLVLFFFFCRYCMLFAFIGLIISLTVTTPVDCRALFTFNSWTGNMTILCASTCLMLRTIALWERRKSIVIGLGLLCLAHWTLLYRTMFIVIAEWDDTVGTCVVVATNPSWLNTTFFFTMGFDFIILMFTAIALLSKHSARTDLWRLLFHDGLVYFLVSFTCNCIPAVLNVLDLNSIMNVIATIPAATITSIAACRAVLRLLEFGSNEVYVHTISAITTSNPARQSVAPFPLAKANKRPEVHVTTEHITMAEFSGGSVTDSPYASNDTRRKTSIDFQSAGGRDSPSDQDDKTTFEFPARGEP